jgi:hypothetical protein
MILPPIGFFSLAMYGPADASGLDITWFDMTTATPNWHHNNLLNEESTGRLTRSYLVGETLQSPKELCQMHLTRRQLSTPCKISTVQRRARIHDQQTKSSAHFSKNKNMFRILAETHLDSDMSALAEVSNCCWWSALYARAYATLSSTSSPFSPYRSATASRRTGRKVPSVSIYKHLPSPPPISTGN